MRNVSRGGQVRELSDDPNNNQPTGVMMPARKDIGETLIEIVVTIVIISLTVGALLSSLGAASNAGNAQRKGVQADSILRNYAAAVKTAVQGCTLGGSGYSVVYAAPAPYAVSGAGSICPLVTAPATMTLTVTGPQGFIDSVVLRVRTP
jgi:type II secretory pathway pseudopilin PulG